jgi:hypothetical protein
MAKSPKSGRFTGKLTVTQVSSWDETVQEYDSAASCDRMIRRVGTQNVSLAASGFRVKVQRVSGGIWNFVVPDSAKVSGTVDRERTASYVGDDGNCTGPPPPIETDCGVKPLALRFTLVAGNKVFPDVIGFQAFMGTFQHCGYPAPLSFLEAPGKIDRSVLKRHHSTMKGHAAQPMDLDGDGTGTITLDWTLDLKR